MNSAKLSARWRVLLFLAVPLGAAVPIDEGCAGHCPDLDRPATYKILTDRDDWQPGSGQFEVTETAFLISYTTQDGSKWEVEYRRPGGI